MKSISIQEVTASDNAIQISIPDNLMDMKIINAVLDTKVSVTTATSLRVDCFDESDNLLWENVDTIKNIQNETNIKIDISDELQYAIDNNLSNFNLKFIGENTIGFSECVLNIDYISLSEYQKNGSSHQFDLGKSGTASVNLSTGRLSMSTSLVSTDNNILPLSITSNYNSIKNEVLPKNLGLPDNWHLNVNQFLIKNSDSDNLYFTYIDENGKNHIIEEIFYYMDQEGQEHTIPRNKLEVDLDGNYKFNNEKIHSKLIAPSGLKLVSSISDIKCAEFVDYEPEDLIKIKQQIKQLESAIKQYTNSLENSKKNLVLSILSKNTLSQEQNTTSETNASEISKEDFVTEISNELSNLKYNIETNELEEIYDNFRDNKPFTLSLTDLISINLQIAQLDFSCCEYELNIDEYNKQLVKLRHQQKQYELQTPVHYLYNDSNIIYGFGKTFDENDIETNIYRLILITDAYENNIIFSYKSGTSNQLEYITDSANNIITFNYDENNYLKEIVDSRETKTILSFSDNIINFISHDKEKVLFKYDTNKRLNGVLDCSGFGIKFNYNNSHQISSAQALSIFKDEGIEHNNPHYVDDFENDDFDFTNCIIDDSIITFVYDNYKSTTIINAKNKKMTYLFDKNGKVRTIYENNFSDSNQILSSQVHEYSYLNDNKSSQKVTNLPYSYNYLSDVHFPFIASTKKEALNLGNLTCGEHSVPYCYPVYANYYSLPTEEYTNKFALISLSAEAITKINGETSTILEALELKNTQNVQNIVDCIHRTFILSGWAKADSAFIIDEESINDYAEYIQNRKFEIRAEIIYDDNSNQTVKFSKTFDWRNTSWQYCALPITLQLKNIKSVICYIDYSENTGTISFTDLELKQGDFESTEYIDDNTYIKDFGHSKWRSTCYLEDSKLIKEVIQNKYNGDEFTTTYTYNKYGKLIKTCDYNNIVKEHTYNDKGSLIKTTTYHKDEPATILCEETLLDDKGQKTHEVNEFGKKLSEYEYIDGTGITSSITNYDGTKTSFGYSQNSTLLQTSTTIDGEENTNIYGYTLDFLTCLTHNNFDIKYTYDKQGRQTKISIADNDYLSKTYNTNEEITQLANGEQFKNIYDNNGNMLETYFKSKTSTEFILAIQNIYDIYGNLLYTKDLTNGQNISEFVYDNFGNIKSSSVQQNNSFVKINNQYDEKNHSQINTASVQIADKTINYNYSYDDTPNSLLKSISISDFNTQNLTYDRLGRIKNINLLPIKKEYTYLKNGNRTSNLISKINFAKNDAINDNLAYKYDEKGNIIEVRQHNKLLARYKYDSLSRLIREDNSILETTTTYEYDAGGNIVCKKVYAFTIVDNLDFEKETQVIPYTYPISGWRDQLISYNGQSFEYDAIGNPTTYRGKTLEWSHGRQLDKFADIAQFTYNASGIRTAKFANGFTTSYFLNGNKIIKQKDASNDMYFYYGVDGITGFNLNGTNYYYKKNAQNDIIGIYDNTGTQICEYQYDAWGKTLCKYLSNSGEYVAIEDNYMYNDISNTNRFVAFKNPFRYRSYYYDFETGLYYLNSRYYDPEIGRFINADDINAINATKITTNGLNLYSYCLNNPVNETDESGYILWWLIAAIVVGALVGGTVNGISAYNQGYRGWDLVGSILGGAIMGGAMGGLLAFGGGVAVGAITGATVGKGILISAIVGISAGWGSYAVETAISPSKQWNTKDFAIAGLSGLLKGLFTYSIGLLSGKVGGFDKLILNPILKGSPAYLKNIIYAFAKATIGRTAFLTPFAEFILKSLSATLPAAAVRKLIDYIFGL